MACIDIDEKHDKLVSLRIIYLWLTAQPINSLGPTDAYLRQRTG